MPFAPLFRVLAFGAAFCAVTLCSGCATSDDAAPEVASDTLCSEPRPQVCTMIYAPVCARHADGSEETLASGCNACADATVVSHREGECEATTP